MPPIRFSSETEDKMKRVLRSRRRHAKRGRLRPARRCLLPLLVVAALALSGPPARAADARANGEGRGVGFVAPSVTGLWRTGRGRSLVEIYRCEEDGSARPDGPFVCGRIRNAKRADVEGHLLLAGFRPKGGAWRKGRIVDPRTRSTYRGRLTLLTPDRLELRGCLLMFCRAQVWERAMDGVDRLPEHDGTGGGVGNPPRPAGP